MDENTQNNKPAETPQAPMPDPIAFKSESTQPSGSMRYAGFWIRLVALLIDVIILAIPFGIIGLLLGVFSGQQEPGQTNPMMLGFQLVTTVAGYGYLVYFTSKQGATLGKKVLGLKVVDANGNLLPMSKVLMREVVGRIVCQLTINIGYIWVAFDAKKQGFHDKIAGSYVIKTK